VRTSSIPKVTLSHSKMLTKLPVKKAEKKEPLGSKVPLSKHISSKETNLKSKTSLVPPPTTSKSIWQTAKSFGRVAPSKVMTTLREKTNDKKVNNKQMVSSTGTESSGVFSDSDNGENVPSAPVKPVRPSTGSSQSSSSRISSTLGRSALKPAKRPALNNDQFIISELRSQIQTLKNQHRDHIEQIKNELGDKFQKEMAAALVDKETQFQNQTETKELTWRNETSRLVEQERSKALSYAEQQWEVTRHGERLVWQQRVDALLQKVAILVTEKEKTDKNILQEVETRIQATLGRYAALQKETSSLEAVYELRCDEVRNLRLELEKVSASAVECVALRERNHTLTNTVEGLQAQLELKVNEERRLRSEISVLTSHYKDEVVKGRRLSMEKEELQYKLSLQCQSTPNESERNAVTANISSTLETPKLPRKTILNYSPITKAKNSDTENNNNSPETSSETSDDADADAVEDVFSPSSSATVRYFTKKNDSVAYVLDLSQSSSVSLYPTPVSPWQRRRNLLRFSSLRWNKSSSH